MIIKKEYLMEAAAINLPLLSKIAVVANFSTSWSTPWRFIATTYRNLADKYDPLVFLTVDVDKLPEFSTSWKIKAAFINFYFEICLWESGRSFKKEWRDTWKEGRRRGVNAARVG
ncbi:thioredoxin H4-1-like protein [Tanacetum coccineum]